LSLVDENSGPA